jgi:hypothetical protein
MLVRQPVSANSTIHYRTRPIYVAPAATTAALQGWCWDCILRLTLKHGKCCIDMPLARAQEAQQCCINVTIHHQRWRQLQPCSCYPDFQLLESNLMILHV